MSRHDLNVSINAHTEDSTVFGPAIYNTVSDRVTGGVQIGGDANSIFVFYPSTDVIDRHIAALQELRSMFAARAAELAAETETQPSLTGE